MLEKVFLDCLHEAETKPLITDLLCIKQDGFIYIAIKMRGIGSVELGESKAESVENWPFLYTPG